MTPTITTILAKAAEAASTHAQALEAHRAAHEQIAAQRGSQPPPLPVSAPAPGYLS